MKYFISTIIAATFFLPSTVAAQTSAASCGAQIFSEKVYSEDGVDAAADRCDAAGGKTGTGETGIDSRGEYGTVTCTNTSACTSPVDASKSVPRVIVNKSPTEGVSSAPTYSNPFCSGGVCKYIPLEPLPGMNQSGTATFSDFLSGIFKLLITLGSMFAVVMLVVAGIGYMLSESAIDISKAKDRAKRALWGLVLLAASWLILFTINPNLLKFNLLVQNVDSGSPSTPSTPTPTANTVKNASVYNDIVSKCGSGKLSYDPDGNPICNTQ